MEATNVLAHCQPKSSGPPCQVPLERNGRDHKQASLIRTGVASQEDQKTCAGPRRQDNHQTCLGVQDQVGRIVLLMAPESREILAQGSQPLQRPFRLLPSHSWPVSDSSRECDGLWQGLQKDIGIVRTTSKWNYAPRTWAWIGVSDL